MDNGEACFILSSRNEVDRTAAVSAAGTSPEPTLQHPSTDHTLPAPRITRPSCEPGL